MSTQTKLRTYRSFLLRLWREGNAPDDVWRFSLEDPHTGERFGFANWDKLREFIKEEMEQAKSNDSPRQASLQ